MTDEGDLDTLRRGVKLARPEVVWADCRIEGVGQKDCGGAPYALGLKHPSNAGEWENFKGSELVEKMGGPRSQEGGYLSSMSLKPPKNLRRSYPQVFP